MSAIVEYVKKLEEENERLKQALDAAIYEKYWYESEYYRYKQECEKLDEINFKRLKEIMKLRQQVINLGGEVSDD